MIVGDAERAIAFYNGAFRACERMRLTMPDGNITHSEPLIGDSALNLGESMEGWPAHALLAQLFVADSGAFFNRAGAAGATVTTPMMDMCMGHRIGHLVDPYGGTWTTSTQTEFVAPAEIEQRLNEFCS
jgi:PhnB protein